MRYIITSAKTVPLNAANPEILGGHENYMHYAFAAFYNIAGQPIDGVTLHCDDDPDTEQLFNVLSDHETRPEYASGVIGIKNASESTAILIYILPLK